MPQIIDVPGHGRVEFPDGMSDADIVAAIKRNMQPEPSLGDKIKQGAVNLAAGALRGAGSIGATLMYPIDKATDMIKGDRDPNVAGLISGKQPLSRNEERRRDLDTGLAYFLGAEPDSLLYKTGKLGGEVAGTAGVGGVLANGARALGAAPSLVSALATSGMRTGGVSSTLADMAARTAGGAITGGASATLVDPKEGLTGAFIGGVLPGATKAVGSGAQMVGNKLLSMVRGGSVSPEVSRLATRAAELGIDVPADRIANSKPLNALAASLNYIPFSGRSATERTMQAQLNRALSRTFGQDSDNVTSALRAARGQLGGEFDRVLQGNQVRVDAPFLDALAQADQRAQAELGADGARVIRNQIDEILSKGATGTIDGQAAYNIKRTLDRIGKRNSPESYYASDLRRDLMGALNRSLSPEDAAAFATTRKQYGNMLSLEKLAQNGVDGDVSIARLANMKNIGNDDLQELADIAAQFLKAREGQHGAMQRVGIGAAGAALGGIPGVVAGAAAGRATNRALKSNALKRLIMGQPITARNQLLDLIANPEAQQLGYRAAPLMQRD
jgi:hypothetical protein